MTYIYIKKKTTCHVFCGLRAQRGFEKNSSELEILLQDFHRETDVTSQRSPGWSESPTRKKCLGLKQLKMIDNNNNNDLHTFQCVWRKVPFCRRYRSEQRGFEKLFTVGSRMCKDFFFFSTRFSKKRKLSDLLIKINFLLTLRCASKKLKLLQNRQKTDK